MSNEFDVDEILKRLKVAQDAMPHRVTINLSRTDNAPIFVNYEVIVEKRPDSDTEIQLKKLALKHVSPGFRIKTYLATPIR